jgi:pyruvoyl-dependent arginine decarboxylase (PvlArgDC)
MIVNDLVDELVLFTHGAVIVGVVLRFESKQDNRFLSSGRDRVTGQQIVRYSTINPPKALCLRGFSDSRTGELVQDVLHCGTSLREP